MVQFKISKPYCVFNFLETTIGNHGTSSTFQAYIRQHIPATDTAFEQLIQAYKNIQLDYSYERPEYPENRHRMRSTYDLISIAAVQSNTMAEFAGRITGILPNSEHHKLCTALENATAYYDRIIWDSCAAAIKAQAQALQQYENQSGSTFHTLQTLYNSGWTDDMPFIVTIYPIPGNHGNTTATPHANSLCVGVLTGEKNHEERMAVVFHEICHVLYDEQPAAFQYNLENYFMNNPSPYSMPAHNFFDEGMATACGNGWAYHELSGKTDTTEWYNNEYINGFGHALYPLVQSYIEQGKTIDSDFVSEAIILFGKTFPKSSDDYAIMLNNVFLYTDAENSEQRYECNNTIQKYFQVSRINTSSPITDPTSAAYIKSAAATQLFIIDRNHHENMQLLKGIFPELKKSLDSKPASNYILSFYDSKRRPVIIINTTIKNGLDKALHHLQQQKYIDRAQPFYSIE